MINTSPEENGDDNKLLFYLIVPELLLTPSSDVSFDILAISFAQWAVMKKVFILLINSLILFLLSNF